MHYRDVSPPGDPRSFFNAATYRTHPAVPTRQMRAKPSPLRATA